MKILLAEDEVQLARVVSAAISHEGYELDAVADGQAAVEMAQKNAYDVIILDIMMPVKTGLEALREIRASGNTTHIIMLTAMAEIDDRVTGLDAGADDYLTKPFSLKELLARLRSMERRAETFSPGRLIIGQTSLDVGENELVSANSIRLAGKESKLLAHLMMNQGKELTTEELFRHVWGQEDEEVDQGFVWIYISYLRQKLIAVGADLEIQGQEHGSFCLLERKEEDHVS